MPMTKSLSRAFSGLAVVAAGLATLSGCSLRDWPYYTATIPGGITIREGPLFRGTWGDQARFAIDGETEFAARTICYPRESGGDQHCHVLVELLHAGAGSVAFDEGQFVVHRPENGEQRFESRTERCRYDGDCFIKPTLPIQEQVIIYFDYQHPPPEFVIATPDAILGGKVVSLPPVEFSYQDSFPYQVVPLWGNY